MSLSDDTNSEVCSAKSDDFGIQNAGVSLREGCFLSSDLWL